LLDQRVQSSPSSHPVREAAGAETPLHQSRCARQAARLHARRRGGGAETHCLHRRPLGLDRDGNLAGAPGDFQAQAVQALENLREALAAVGAGFEHIVKVNNYLVDIKHLPILREVRRRYFNMAAPPASTTIAILEFAREGALYEIDAIAVLPD
jgi:enamine deaminase RidA (YjgF/YER057c/UK114 family)